MENAGNDISKPLDFKIFWGSMPPDPSSGSRLRRSRAPQNILPLLRHWRVGDFHLLQEMNEYTENCVGILGTAVKEMRIRSNIKPFFFSSLILIGHSLCASSYRASQTILIAVSRDLNSLIK